MLQHEFCAQQGCAQAISTNVLKVYMSDICFICPIKSPKCTDKYSKKTYSIVIVLPRVLIYQKREISLSVGYKTARPRNEDWE